jgi:hypothetical protein
MMPIHAAEVRIFGTIYVKAPNIDEGRIVFQRLCWHTIDARDRVWFSDASFEGVPEVSRSTSLTGDVVLEKAQQKLKDEMEQVFRLFESKVANKLSRLYFPL